MRANGKARRGIFGFLRVCITLECVPRTILACSRTFAVSYDWPQYPLTCYELHSFEKDDEGEEGAVFALVFARGSVRRSKAFFASVADLSYEVLGC